MIELTAIRVGFYDGSRVRVGETFSFDDQRFKAPKWAKPATEAQKLIAEDKAREKRAGGDTKPVAAAKAAQRRATGQAITD